MNSRARITVEMENDGSEFAAQQIRELLKRVHEVERQWEKELGENSAFLTHAVRFEVSTSSFEVWQTGKKLKFADEDNQGGN